MLLIIWQEVEHSTAAIPLQSSAIKGEENKLREDFFSH